MMKLSPSLLSADFARLKEELEKVENAGSQYIHLDVMDGAFVPNISFGAPVIKRLRPVSNMVFDVHLMIEEPIRYVEDFAKAGADIICVHTEACQSVTNTINKIKELGCKAAITIKPGTPLDDIYCFLDKVDMVLIMSVEPGFGGQKFMPDMLEKVRGLKKVKKEKNLNFNIEIDGGIDLNNVRDAINAGANVIVAGSAVFGKEDSAKAVNDFLSIFEEFDKQ